jgi:hypothetical protein
LERFDCVMQPDDEVVFGRALDGSRDRCEQIEHLQEALERDAAARPAVSVDLTLAMAAFELHGATLRSLAKWYPGEDRVQLAALEWERSCSGLAKRS